MAYRKHFLLQWGGSLFGGSEIWSNSIRMAGEVEESLGAPSPEEYENALTDLVADIRLLHDSVRFSNALTVDWVKFNRINATGHYEDASRTFERRLSGTTGLNAQIKGQSSNRTPGQLALAVTLRTARQRGVGSRGRFFLGGLAGMPIEADGRIPVTDRDIMVGQVQAFVNNLNNWPGMDTWRAPRVIVATPGGRGQLEGLNVAVTEVQVGRVLDTQRRRRNSLAEDYGTAPVQ